MMFNLINVAYADAAPVIATSSKFDFKGLIPIALFFVVMYFFLVRPQQKKYKQQSDLIASIRRGDKVIVAGGVIGSVHKIVGHEEIIVEIAENVRIKVLKSSVSQVLAKTEPVSISAKMNNSIDHDVEDSDDAVDVVSQLSEPLAKVKKTVKNNLNFVSKDSNTQQPRSVIGKTKKSKEKL